MDITVQIKTIIFSFAFGFLFSLFLHFNYKYIVGRKLLSLVFTLLFVFVFTLLFFICLQFINNGIFHYYEIICIAIGFTLESLLFVEKKFKK